jgi:hypothetical protein
MENSTLSRWILNKFDISVFLENLSRKVKFRLNLRKIKEYFTCTSYLPLFFFEWEMFQKKLVEKIQNTHFIKVRGRAVKHD